MLVLAVMLNTVKYSQLYVILSLKTELFRIFLKFETHVFQIRASTLLKNSKGEIMLSDDSYHS